MVLRRQLRAQPQQAGGINRSHPLADSLVFCGVQSSGVYVDLVSGQVAAQTGTLDTVVLPSAAGSRAVGEARGLRPQANGYLKFAKQTGLDRLTTTGTVLCIAYSAGQHSTFAQYAISSYEEVVAFYGFAFGFDDFAITSDDGTVLRITNSAGTTQNSSGAVLGNPHANKLHAMGGAWDGTSNYLYYNSLTRATIAGIRTPPSDANRRTNINRMSVSSLGTTGNVLCVGFNRVLTQAEYQAWALAPWAILAPTSRRLWLGPPDALVISFDASSNSGYQAASAGYTFTRTVAGSNRFLVVDVALLSAGQTVTSITDDSTGTPVALTLIGMRTSVTGTGRTESWGLVAPALGTKTISVVLSGSIASSSAAVSYVGVHQTTPTEAWNSASATNVGAADATVTITPVASNTWIHGMVATDDTAITANQTSRNNISGAGGSGADEDTGPIASPTPTAVSYTGVGALATWVMGGFAIRPASASGGGGGAALAASPASTSTATAELTTAISLAAAPASTSTATANLSTAIALAASAASQSSATAALTTAITLAASAASQSSATAALTTAITLAASAVSTSTATAALTALTASLASDAQSVSTAAASLTTGISLAAACFSQSTVTATLSTPTTPLAAAGYSQSTVTASLTTAITLQASAVGQVTVTADLTTSSYSPPPATKGRPLILFEILRGTS